MTKYLLELPGIDIDVQDFKGDTPLHLALIGSTSDPDPMRGYRGYLSKFDIYKRRLECASLLADTKDMSTAPNVFKANNLELNCYHSALLEQKERTDDMKQTRNSVTESVYCISEIFHSFCFGIDKVDSKTK